jgi:WD40 repeat protein
VKRLGFALLLICSLGISLAQVSLQPVFSLPKARALGFSADSSKLFTYVVEGYYIQPPVPMSRFEVLADGQLKLLDTVTESKLALAVSPEGYLLRLEGGVCRWDTALNNYACNMSGATISPDGRLLALTNRYGYVQVWDVTSGQRIRTLLMDDWRIERAAFSRDSRLLAVCQASGTVVYRVSDWAVLARLGRPDPMRGYMPSGNCTVGGLAFTPDSKRLVIASTGAPVGIWNLESGRLECMLKRLTDRDGRVRDPRRVAVTADGKHVAVTDAGQNLILYDLQTGRVVAKLEDAGYNLLVSPTLPLIVTEKFGDTPEKDALLGFIIR